MDRKRLKKGDFFFLKIKESDSSLTCAAIVSTDTLIHVSETMDPYLPTG